MLALFVQEGHNNPFADPNSGSAESEDAMQDFIEVFNSRDPQTPYYAIVWRSYTVAGIARCAHLANVVAYCDAYALPVVCKNEDMRNELSLSGIEAHAFETRMMHWQENEPQHLTSRVVGSLPYEVGHRNSTHP